RDERNGRVCRIFGHHSDVLRIGSKGNAERTAAQRAILTKRDAIERPGRGDRHGAIRGLQSGTRQQPTGYQCLSKGYRHTDSSGVASKGEAVTKPGPGATKMFGDPSKW